jgi:pimeloyl-ACP methyl ester carboxylesterase
MLKSIAFRKAHISFIDQGKGRAIVLLHGYLGSKEIWEKTTQNLSRSYRVIAIDLPGHGESECLGYAHSMEMLAKCVKHVMDALRLKKYVLIGHSMGGYTALAFAELFPDSLKGLALLNSTALADSEEKKKDRNRAIQLIKKNKKVYTRNTIKNLFATRNIKYLKEEIAFATKIALRTGKQGAIASLEGMKDRPNRDIILGMVEYPLLMVIGELDNILPHASLLEQAGTLRNKQICYLEYDGHMSFLENPRIVHQHLRKFLRKCF